MPTTLSLKHILNPGLNLCLPTVKAPKLERVGRLFLLLQRASALKGVTGDWIRQFDACP